MPQIAIGVGLSLIGTVISANAQAKQSKKMQRLAEEQAALRKQQLDLDKKTKKDAAFRRQRAITGSLRRGLAGRGLDTERADIAEQNIGTSFEGAQSILDQSYNIQSQIADVGAEMSQVQYQSPGMASQLLSGAAQLGGGYIAGQGVDNDELKFLKDLF